MPTADSTPSDFEVALSDCDAAVANQQAAGDTDSLYEAYCRRGDLHCSKRNYPLALADYDRAIELSPRAEAAYLCRAKLYEARHNPVQAKIERVRAERAHRLEILPPSTDQRAD